MVRVSVAKKEGGLDKEDNTTVRVDDNLAFDE